MTQREQPEFVSLTKHDQYCQKDNKPNINRQVLSKSKHLMIQIREIFEVDFPDETISSSDVPTYVL